MTASVLADVLENTVWHALTSAHASFAIGDGLARRYPPEVSPLAGLVEQSDDAFWSLSRIVSPGESVFVFLNAPPALPEASLQLFDVKATFTIDQMVCESFRRPEEMSVTIEPLGDDAVPEMLALTKLTNPGPFEPATNTMGRYAGILKNGRLAAMAGERLNLADYTEVSAVCTHPDFRGNGYAKELVASVSTGIITEGKTPILHTLSDNAPAVHVYESLGFRKSRPVHFAILSRKPL